MSDLYVRHRCVVGCESPACADLKRAAPHTLVCIEKFCKKVSLLDPTDTTDRVWHVPRDCVEVDEQRTQEAQQQAREREQQEREQQEQEQQEQKEREREREQQEQKEREQRERERREQERERREQDRHDRIIERLTAIEQRIEQLLSPSKWTPKR